MPTDFVVESLDGSRTTLAASRGKVRIVNAWASWCRPCRAELPSLRAMADSLGGEVEVLAVAIDQPGNVRRFVSRQSGLPPVYLEHQSIPREWGRWGLPTTWVIGPDDRLLHVHFGAASWDDPAVLSKLRRLIEDVE
ncbi:MAG TPA: TlpA disulfide reductase family protein [Gemmatimonadales bacterium]|nr:TlpA disulfide reductase family protein [Gemmatimonadales bacterium]